ncbi:MAG: hypothetical protein IT190_04765 [Microbacteriaceae bacterium]|nr:hypothetical protein [Microbacteriaceae bacterium]
MVTAQDVLRRRRAPAHRAPSGFRLRSVTIGGILTSALLVGVGAFLGLTSTGSTYAFFNGSGTSPSSTVTAGSMALRVGAAGSEAASYTIPSAAWSSLLPGDTVRQQVSVKVTNSPSRVSSGLNIRTTAPVPAGFELRVQKGVCTAGVLTGTPLSTADVGFGTWSASETSPVCVQVTLRADVPNSLQTSTVGPIGMIVTAKQQ